MISRLASLLLGFLRLYEEIECSESENSVVLIPISLHGMKWITSHEFVVWSWYSQLCRLFWWSEIWKFCCLVYSLNSTGKSIGNGKWQITRILTFLLLSNGKLPFPCSFFHWNEKQWRYFLSIAVSAMDDARQLRVFP